MAQVLFVELIMVHELLTFSVFDLIIEDKSTLAEINSKPFP
jgi:hypothetical protein